MLALDVATKCGVCFDRSPTLYIATVVGSPSFQLNWIKLNTTYQDVVIEELVAYNAKNPKILVNLAQRVGYIYHHFVEDDIPVEWAHPGSWRKNLGLIQSKAGSRELQIAVKEQFKVVLNLDEIDAVGIWLYGAKMKLEDISHWRIEKMGNVFQGN